MKAWRQKGNRKALAEKQALNAMFKTNENNFLLSHLLQVNGYTHNGVLHTHEADKAASVAKPSFFSRLKKLLGM